MYMVARSPAPDGRASLPPGNPATGDGVPQGFVPVEKMKALPAMGRWTPLPDGMPPWLPFQALAEMARREQAGDEAAHRWLEIYRHAVQGDTAAQRRMGGSFESGGSGIPVDMARAFFWYHRAALTGDAAARERAFHLKSKHDIPPAALEDPVLVYAGLWRLRREDDTGASQPLALELHEDRRLSGTATHGLWTYDRTRRVLTLAHNETWRVRIVACRDPVLFGRDEHGRGCTLERTGPLGPH